MHLTETEQKIISALALEGLTQQATADKIGMSLRSLELYLEEWRYREDCKTTIQLFYKIAETRKENKAA